MPRIPGTRTSLALVELMLTAVLAMVFLRQAASAAAHARYDHSEPADGATEL
jgi:hypothetical protein